MNSQGGLPPRSAAFAPPPEPPKPKVPVWFYIGGGALFLLMFAALVVTSTLLFVQSKETEIAARTAAPATVQAPVAAAALPQGEAMEAEETVATRASVNLLDSELQADATPTALAATAAVDLKPSTLDVLKSLNVSEKLPNCVDYLDTMAKITDVRFPLGSNLPHTSDLPRVRNIATALALCPDVKMVVEGHSDQRGNPVINRDLSWYRAETVIQILKSEGFDTTGFEPQGFGATRPINLSGTDAGEAENRRVQFMLVPADTVVTDTLARN